METALQALESEFENIKGEKSLEGALEKFTNAQQLQKFQTRLDEKIKQTSTGFGGHMKK